MNELTERIQAYEEMLQGVPGGRNESVGTTPGSPSPAELNAAESLMKDLANAYEGLTAFLEAARRLRDVGGLDLPEPIPGLKELAVKRNGLTHHGVSVAPQELQSNAGAVLDFVMTFIDKHLRDDEGSLPELFEKGLENLRPLLAQIHSLVQKRMQSLSKQLDGVAIRLGCFACGQPTLVPVAGEQTWCPFCLGDFDPVYAAREYVEVVLDISEYDTHKGDGTFPLYVCPDCLQTTLVEGVKAIDWDAGNDMHDRWWPYWLCMSCAEPYPPNEFDHCIRCEEPTREGGDTGTAICHDCYSAVAGLD